MTMEFRPLTIGKRPFRNHCTSGLIGFSAQVYPKPRYDRHPLDCSVMSYRGHSVLRTLIRCNFSPAETTGSRYIYSGSSDGMVHVGILQHLIIYSAD